jgi:hypothetical protein
VTMNDLDLALRRRFETIFSAQIIP